MMLDGIVYPVKYSKGAEATLANTVSPTDEVFERFLSLCECAGPGRCALAGASAPRPRGRAAVLAGEARADPGPGGEPAWIDA